MVGKTSNAVLATTAVLLAVAATFSPQQATAEPPPQSLQPKSLPSKAAPATPITAHAKPAKPTVNAEKPIGILLAVGDIAHCGTEYDEIADEKVAKLVERAVAEAKQQGLPVRLILMGDLAYEAGTKAEFKDCFDPEWGQFKKIMLPIPGNHEYTPKLNGKRYRPKPKPIVQPVLKSVKARTAHYNRQQVPSPTSRLFSTQSTAFIKPKVPQPAEPKINIEDLEHAKPYFNYFWRYPKNNRGRPLVSSEGPQTGYYTIRFPKNTKGSWLLVGINSYTKSKVRPKWKDWLKAKLKAHERSGRKKARCILAFSHHFRYSSGLHGHYYEEKDSWAELGDRSHMQKAFKILQRYRTSVLLSGHDHHYEQFPRMDNYWGPDKRGIRSFLVGTGGAELYLDVIKRNYKTDYKHMSELTEHLIKDKYGIMRLELYPERYAWQFLPVDGPPIIPKIHEDTCRTQ